MLLKIPHTPPRGYPESWDSRRLLKLFKTRQNQSSFYLLTSLVDFLKTTEHTTLKLTYEIFVAEHYNKW